MSETNFTWRERASESELIASVWTCHAVREITRTIVADPCIALALVNDGSGNREVVVSGPGTSPRSEFLASGYECTAVRLRPGAVLRGFPAQALINGAQALPADTAARFWLEGQQLQFPDYDHAEQLIEQLQDLGYLDYKAVSAGAQTQSCRSHFRLVKRTTGLSPYQLQQLERIHEAFKLLKQDVPAAAVAAELGFTDQAHLAHASRQFLGHTPKELLGLPQTPKA